jgi:type I restriction enzyme S subunit
VQQGDLILALTRPYISTGLKVSACPPLYHNSLLNQRVAAIRVFTDTEFLYQYMQSDYVLGLYQRRFGGSGLQPNLKMGDVTDLVIPVPPVKEQHRIVAKVDQLMALCDQLKTRLNTAQTTQLQLADTVVDEALN